VFTCIFGFLLSQSTAAALLGEMGEVYTFTCIVHR